MMKKIQNLNLKNKWVKGIMIVLLSLLVISVILSFTILTIIESLRIVFGSIYVLFLPGFLISYIFFPISSEKSIDWLERIALSLALSIAIVPLAIFYLNLIGLKISAVSSFFTILGILIISAGIIIYRKRQTFVKRPKDKQMPKRIK